MIIVAKILMKDNSIIIKKVKNPSHEFKVKYKSDGVQKEYTYSFEREKVFIEPRFIGKRRVIFYEHGSKKPLDVKFNTKETTLNEINSLMETGLINKLIDSTHDNSKAMSLGLVLGLAGILAIVLIVIFG